MNRQELWDRLKAARITQSTRPDCPPDADLKVVIAFSTVSPKHLIDFICNLNGGKHK